MAARPCKQNRSPDTSLEYNLHIFFLLNIKMLRKLIRNPTFGLPITFGT
jgi:hypothetical protein